MSTEPTPTHDTRPTATTETAARGRPDPWATTDEGRPATALAPRQFEPYSTARMRNLMDDDNAHSG